MVSFLYFSRVRRNTIGGARLSEHYGVNVESFYDIEAISRVFKYQINIERTGNYKKRYNLFLIQKSPQIQLQF